MRHRIDDSAGFTLIEMMIAVAVMGIVTAQLFVVFANQKRVYMSNERALDVQETSRLTLDLISFDTRMAGYMVPEYAAVSSVDGGTDHADRLCVSSPSTASKDATALEDRWSRFDGARVFGISSNTVTVDKLDYDGDGFDDFTPNSGVIVASSGRTYCARILSAAGTTITFALPAGEDATTYLGGATPDMVAVPANVYELDEDPTKLELRRNSMLLASQIEDFQVEYWIDNAGIPNNGIEDGDREFPVNDLNAPDPPTAGMTAKNEFIRRVRVSVSARTLRDEGSNSAAGHLMGGRPALANRTAGADADTFRRRSFSASIMPRNVSVLKEQDKGAS
jgi:prepilin-type N-terminal cleavage/methylation domain-containing protein